MDTAKMTHPSTSCDLPAERPEPKKCTCGAPATRKAGKSGWAGTDLCDHCWRLDFTDPRDCE
jgi:hypothetical protein